jgi:metal-responsive CopG/Arc/MetJ family transcriptional regulator
MKRTTITLTDELATALERETRRSGMSVSELTRRALASHLGLDAPRQIPFAALGNSGPNHTARDLEELIADEWSRDRDR